MVKNLVLALPVLALIYFQGFFIYALSHGGAHQFVQTWQSFGIEQTGYSRFVFSTIQLWWALPVLCTVALGLSLAKMRAALILLTLLACLLGNIALLWSAYAPSLLISI